MKTHIEKALPMFPWILLLNLLFGLSAAPALSHEFWIEPKRYQVKTGEEVLANLKNGEMFNGIALPYFERRTARFEVMDGAETTRIAARMGDIPALSHTAGSDGLLVVVHQSAPHSVTYSQWEKFEHFANQKNLEWALQEHAKRGLPRVGFEETFTRYAKSLVAIRSGTGQDRATGMETEFIAVSNPYAEAARDGVLVQLLYQGEPRRNAQVEVFEKSQDGSVSVSIVQTDDLGKAKIPVQAGHDYLLNAVLLREPETQTGSAAWESLWASLTFHVP